MPPKKRSPPLASSTSFSALAFPSLETMRRSLECPICLEIPRDGVMLQCRNGHNVCAVCKGKIGDKNCPQCRRRFSSPAIRNRTVACLIDSLPFEFACKYKASGCDFKGTKDLITSHEEACGFRPVPCPFIACKESVPAWTIVDHFETAHKTPCRRAVLDVMTVNNLWNAQPFNCVWNVSPFETSVGRAFPCATSRNGLVYFWLLMVAPPSQTEKLRCDITLSKDSSPATYTYSAPVYSIDAWNRERILADDDCVCLSNYSIRQVLTDNVSENERNSGYIAKFKVAYSVKKESV